MFHLAAAELSENNRKDYIFIKSQGTLTLPVDISIIFVYIYNKSVLKTRQNLTLPAGRAMSESRSSKANMRSV